MRIRLVFAACGILFASGTPMIQAQAANRLSGCVETFDPAADYFPDKVAIGDAENFRVEYRRSYKVVSIKEPFASGVPERHVLVQCGTPPPPLTGDLAGAQMIPVPITSLFVFSTTHLSLLADLERADVITGVAQGAVVDDAAVVERIRSGKVTEFARNVTVIDVERVVTSKPAMLMSGGAANTTLAVIRNAGVPVVANTEWLEPTALARAEWLKYMAMFLNEERKAEALYGAMKARYRAISARALEWPEGERPRIMTGRSTRGVFVIAGGRSYVAAYIKDAGGRYVWPENTAGGSSSVDLEAQIIRAASADIWINGGGWTNRQAMLEDEPRYQEFKAFRDNQVWVYERRQTPAGGNDYWSRGVTHPDLVLADLVKIFHPRLTPGHAFAWYMQVPAR